MSSLTQGDLCLPLGTPTSSSPLGSPGSCQPPAHALPSAHLSSPNLARPGRLQPSQTLETSAQSPPPPGIGGHREHSHPWGWSHPWGHSYHWGQGVGDVILIDEARGAGPGRVARRPHTHTHTHRDTHTHTHTHTLERHRSRSPPRSQFVLQTPSPAASPRALGTCGLSRAGP